jgi:mannose-6-phosphate isomerase
MADTLAEILVVVVTALLPLALCGWPEVEETEEEMCLSQLTRGIQEIVPKPWGYELIWAHTAHYAGKILSIRRGCRLSFQFHERKHESFYLLSGRLEVVIEGEDGERRCHLARSGESFHIPAGCRHRLRALTPCRVLEVSTPELDDIVRLQDDYGRAQ